MSNGKTLPLPGQQAILDQVKVRLLEAGEQPRFQALLARHHYWGRIRPVGERLCYVATDAQGQWLALLVFNVAAKHLKHRDRWIGWTAAQRDRRLRLVTNNSRFLLLPDRTVPNLGSKVRGLVLARLRQDWQTRYGHPVVGVESFVDPAQFDGTVYRAQGWQELGATDGWGRCRRDYYVKPDKPKRLFVRELCRNACRSLQAEHLRPELADVETNEIPVARQMMEPLDLQGRIVVVAALHTQAETARLIVMEKGGDYLLTVKDNPPPLRQNIDHLIPAPEAGFSPTEAHRPSGPDGGVE